MVSKSIGGTNEENRITIQRGDEIDITWLLGQVSSLMNHCVGRDLSRSPLSSEGLWFLTIVYLLGEDATPGEVAKWMVRKHNSVYDMLKRLEEKGYVERHQFKRGTKGQMRIALTEDGKHIHDTVPWPNAIPRALSCFSAKEKKQLRRLLLKWRKQAAAEARVYEEPPYPSP